MKDLSLAEARTWVGGGSDSIVSFSSVRCAVVGSVGRSL